MGIVLILIVSFLLHFFRLNQEGLANLYYAAGVKSMLMNWHNFFFVAFDPGGFISIDKPPLGFWLQAISAKIFGFHGWSIILPQALGGVISVYMIYILIKCYHGRRAGLLSALILAFTPIFVAASRNNTIDVLLVTTLLFAVWVFFSAIEEMKLKKLLLAFFLIGVGFNIKSMEAFLILPAFYITYFLNQYGQFKKKVIHLLAATMILVVSSLPWFIAVDSISPAERPYVGSSEMNSEIELATGYNSLGHFLGYGVRMPGRQSQITNQAKISSANYWLSNNRPRSGGEAGLPGAFRLFNHQLGGQISWLLPFACIGVAMGIYQFRRGRLANHTKMTLLFWSCWLVPQVIFFSIAQGAHRYYLVMMAPAIAALVGIQYHTLEEWVESAENVRFLLPLAIGLTIASQLYIISEYTQWRFWIFPLVLVVGVLAGILLFMQSVKVTSKENKEKFLVLGIGIWSMLIAPLAWSLTPVLYGAGNAAFPFAGPDLNPQSREENGQLGMNFSRVFRGIDTDKLEDFLVKHESGEKYIVAVPNAHLASPIILKTEQPVITYGGFMGAEKILDEEQLEQIVVSGQLRYIMIGNGDNDQQSAVNEWVIAHGVPVADAEWKDVEQTNESDSTVVSKRKLDMKLYDCRM